MKIVITGALGHIGSYLIRDFFLQFPESEIWMIDNMLTQRFPSLFNLPEKGNYHFIEEDINQIEFSSILKDANVLIHLAAMTDAAGSFDKADILEENNYQSTFRVATACAKYGVRLISISSTSVYGSQSEVVSEDCSFEELKPQSPYASTKIKEELLISKLVSEEGLRAITCRFGTIFGASPGMRFHTAVNKFCWQAVMGKPITIWKTAYDQKRPYLDIVDASNAISFIVRNEIFDGGVYNILTHNLTVRQVIQSIEKLIPKLQISFVDNRIMNQLSYEVTCERFSGKGFKFSGNLDRGISDTIGLIKNANNFSSGLKI
jgi:nucleoside-diphosphate-sugar epimerase